ncbi:MAG: right-handed parallel beta-helix repeat-containing protein [Euryarchaeota archaeon]|nr:right-handed parallel beta-helix repeat-containing protein [Euryarchaeota archaeon]
MGGATGKGIAISVGILMMLSAVVIGSQQTGEGAQSPPGKAPASLLPISSNYVAHAPIRINSDVEFASMAASEGWAGDGTQGNPYIIENYDISGSGYRGCIYIGNTTSYFVLRNCYLHHATGTFSEPYFTDSGLALCNAQNGSITNNIVMYDVEGIYGNLASHNIFSNNTVKQNSDGGIYFLSCSSNTFMYNNCSNNAAGISLKSGSNSNNVVNNTFNSTSYWGLDVTSSLNNFISNNTASANSKYGFYLRTSSNSNTIVNNTISANIQYGIVLELSSSNTIYQNNFINNTNHASDNRNDNWWNASYPTGGNYWSNYAGVDLLSGPSQDQPGSDGFSDTPYNIDADSKDAYPIVIDVIIACTYPIDGSILPNTAPSTYIIQFNKVMDKMVGIISTNLPGVTWTWSADGIWYNGTYGALQLSTTYYVDLIGGGFMDYTGSPLTGDNYKNFTTWDGIHCPPFRINSDAEFASMATSEGWAGDGTQGNPYIIENYDIDGTGFGYCIYVGNTTDYFVVRNCYLHHASGNSGTYYWNSGIVFYNVQNGIIANNTASSNNDLGIYLYSSSSNIIANNTASSNNYYGILLESSTSNTIVNNTASSNNDLGIYLYSSSSNTITNNTASNNFNGILLSTSSYNVIENNTAFSNLGGAGVNLSTSDNNLITNNSACSNGQGIFLSRSNWNTIIFNELSDNQYSDGPCGIWFRDKSDYNDIAYNNITNNFFGIWIQYRGEPIGSNGNNITNNTFLSNYAGINIAANFATANRIIHNNFINNINYQASTVASNYWYASYPYGGNYWSDYNGLDVKSGSSQSLPGADGIGDTPYTNIQGGTGAADKYPLMVPCGSTSSYFKIPVHLGWNLISTPLLPSSKSLPSVFIDTDGNTSWDRVQSYSPSTPTNLWMQYYTGWASSLNDLKSADQTIGVWLNVTNLGDGYINVSGNITPFTTIPLYAGWNLIGYPAKNDSAYTIANLMSATGATIVEGYDGLATYRTSPLSDTYVLKRGEGYWVYMSSPTTWVVDW